MSTDKYVKISFPVGRIVSGSLYELRTKGLEGKDLTKPIYFFALAIPKKPGETSWTQTEWGKKIVAVGQRDFPNGQHKSPNFSWKVLDGDSTTPTGAKQIQPCQREGHSGNWVVSFSQVNAIKKWDKEGRNELLEENFINRGDYVSVKATTTGNSKISQPGVYLNPIHVLFVGTGKRIEYIPDLNSFDKTDDQLPAGYSAPVVEQASLSDSLGFDPHEDILNVKKRVMTEKAKGMTYENYIDAGFTDELLIAKGLMVYA